VIAQDLRFPVILQESLASAMPISPSQLRLRRMNAFLARHKYWETNKPIDAEVLRAMRAWARGRFPLPQPKGIEDKMAERLLRIGSGDRVAPLLDYIAAKLAELARSHSYEAESALSVEQWTRIWLSLLESGSREDGIDYLRSRRLVNAWLGGQVARGLLAASVVGPIFGNICYSLLVRNTLRREEDEGGGSSSCLPRAKGSP